MRRINNINQTSKTTNTPISSWIKIDDNVFYIVSGDVQLSIGSHADISIKLDVHSNPNYYTYFIKKFEQQSHWMDLQTKSSDIKFDMHHRNFISKGTLMKSMDVNFNEMSIVFTCDYLNTKDKQEIRDDIINDILDK